ncbi:hypothetical protein GLOIN_2v1761163 [Rhizophagus clarus]|uniref:Uncharacterized protein n=1 Tax=Rhizophagus clarus TaxID=94130 RepID=A0A8H3M5K4_9GLOM|nr:hypothetical protein GLOIN_2v1761163 [Rhizophagus clarus]
MDALQPLIAKKVLISKYFIQLLFKYFRMHNQDLFEVDRICAFREVKLCLTSNLPILIHYAKEDLPLSVTIHLVNHGPRMLRKTENNPIKFLPRSRSLQLIPIPKHHLFKDGFKKQLHQVSSLRSSSRFTYNVKTFGLRMIKQRRRNRFIRQRNTIMINLSRIINIPQQTVVNDPFINQFFNGFPF